MEVEKGIAMGLLDELAREMPGGAGADEVRRLRRDLEKQPSALRRDLVAAVHGALLATAGKAPVAGRRLADWKLRMVRERTRSATARTLYISGPRSALAIPPVPAAYADDAPLLNGFEVVNACFDAALARCPNVVALGEDVGQIGDVNQGFAGLQAKYGPLRVTDTGIREVTIMGQAIGMALRGLRPIAEIQYLDYVLYALQILSDDVANLHWRTKGRQKAPIIVRTRGHRLEGIWHSGSPMAGVLNLVRGMYVCVPRNMTQAAGFYNTLLESDDPAIVVEVLNGYRQKEKLPANIGELKLPLGVPEVLRPGRDVTVVTYGACCRIALEAAEKLAEHGIEAEVIDVQTLLPSISTAQSWSRCAAPTASSSWTRTCREAPRPSCSSR